MNENLKNLMSTEDLAKATGLSIRRIQQLAPELIAKGLAKKIGRPLVCDRAAIDYIKNGTGYRAGCQALSSSG